VEAALEGQPGSTFGVGLHHNIVTASVQAVVSAANRLAQREQPQPKQPKAAATTA